MGSRGSSSGMGGGRSSAGSSLVRLTRQESALINGDIEELQRAWLEEDEEWARNTDPVTVAYEILNSEERGRGYDADFDNKLDAFEDYFDYDPDDDAQYDRVTNIAFKLQAISNRNILSKYPEIKAAYNELQREDY